SYKILGNFLHGTLHEFYRDRNKLYFKNFFYDRELYKLVKEDLEWLHPAHKNIRMTITRRGVITYDNYKVDGFNVLLLTLHSGTWMPSIIERKMLIPPEQRYREEDIDTHRIYSKLVLEQGGIWIDNKQSRYLIDFNRPVGRAIYFNNSEEWLNIVWNEPLVEYEMEEIFASYHEFYFTLEKLVRAYKFNIIIDAHSMRGKPGRPNISFGTRYIPPFYMPIVKNMQKKLISLGYAPVLLNVPYEGGYVLKWLSKKFPHTFIFSMEINKKLYMNKDFSVVLPGKRDRISRLVNALFELGEESEEE
ncbi:hypothetical protein COY95_04190, partial [Candidatus Woesearchaeota archaeon CG_4_10_14_0_8_um_filter_47_5]